MLRTRRSLPCRPGVVAHRLFGRPVVVAVTHVQMRVMQPCLGPGSPGLSIQGTSDSVVGRYPGPRPNWRGYSELSDCLAEQHIIPVLSRGFIGCVLIEQACLVVPVNAEFRYARSALAGFLLKRIQE